RNPLEERPSSLRRVGLTAADGALVTRRIDQLDAALRAEDEEDGAIPPRTHAVSRISASSIDRPGPKAMASTRPSTPARCIASSTEKLPALGALPGLAQTQCDV